MKARGCTSSGVGERHTSRLTAPQDPDRVCDDFVKLLQKTTGERFSGGNPWPSIHRAERTAGSAGPHDTETLLRPAAPW
jgi:hypothetical protein